MMRLGLSKVVQGLLLGSVVLAAAGCHKNQNAQNTAAQNPSAQSASQPANPDNSSASAVTSPTPNNPVPDAAPASSSAPSSANPATTDPAATSAPTSSAQSAAPAPAPAGVQQASNAPQPAPVVVPDGTVLHIRINQRISVKTSHEGDPFDGTIVSPVAVNGVEVIPAGSIARGHVVASHKRGHFKGRSVLELTLTGLDVNGRHYRLDTGTVVRTKNGKGKRTAAFIGGGAGVGMLIGGVASGGVGLLIGGLSGAGAGTLGAAFTGNKDIDIPAETVMTFKLDQPIQLQ
jgi:hypothetical protein